MSDTLGEAKNGVDALKRSGVAVATELRELRDRFSAHLASLDAIRSKPTPPVSPTLPNSTVASLGPPSTSRSGQLTQLDLAQKQELAAMVLPSVRQSIQHSFATLLGASGNVSKADLDTKITAIQTMIESQLDTRVSSVSSTITSLQE